MIPNPWPGFHFVFEGIDGYGKTSQRNMTSEWLNKTLGDRNPISIVLAKEPGRERYWGDKIYRDLENKDNRNALHKKNPFVFQTWFALDSRENHNETIIPALKEGQIVLSDRSRPSMVFGAQKKSDITSLIELNEAILGEFFILPDKVLVFDVSIKTALLRSRKKSQKLDGHENQSVLQRTRLNYRHFCRTFPNCIIIDAEGTPEQVFEQTQKVILETMGKRERL